MNHLGKLSVTSDAATIMRELEMVHPAGKPLVMASRAQESEVMCRGDLEDSEIADWADIQMGDATTTVIILGGELLKKSEHLLIRGRVGRGASHHEFDGYSEQTTGL
jgi:chaperonin GroEL (HSP60 family)